MKILTKTEVKALVRLYRRWLLGPGMTRDEAYVDGDVCKACSPKYMHWQSRLLWQAEQWLRQTGIPGSPWDVLMRPAAFSGYAPDAACGDSSHLLRNRDRRGDYDTWPERGATSKSSQAKSGPDSI